jgi:hypothetical protein
MLRAVEATPEQAASFARALSAALEGWTRDDFVGAVAAESEETLTASALSLYLNAKNEPSRAKVFAMERVLNLRPGELSRHLGYLPVEAQPIITVEDALVSAGVRKGLREALMAAVEVARTS